MNNIKILMIGDIVGNLGMNTVSEYIPKLKSKYQPDFIIANGENAFHNGKGINVVLSQQLFSLGVDCITLGNHTWAQREIYDYLESNNNIIRPLNFPEGVPGKGYTTITKNNINLNVINLMGRGLMGLNLDCPFTAMSNLLDKLEEDSSSINFVDFHAETTSEKLAFGWFVDGRVSAVVGTHTHVQTADDRVLPNGTGYITDVGMVGPYDGIIGVERELIIRRYLNSLPVKFAIAKGRFQFNGVLLEINKSTKKTEKITKIRIDDDNPFWD